MIALVLECLSLAIIGFVAGRTLANLLVDTSNDDNMRCVTDKTEPPRRKSRRGVSHDGDRHDHRH